MIPLITHTPRLLLLAASRALLTAELHKPQYFPTLLGAALPADWPPGEYDQEAMRYFLEQLTAGGRTAAGWYTWYALRKATDETPRTLIGAGGFGSSATKGVGADYLNVGAQRQASREGVVGSRGFVVVHGGPHKIGVNSRVVGRDAYHYFRLNLGERPAKASQHVLLITPKDTDVQCPCRCCQRVISR